MTTPTQPPAAPVRRSSLRRWVLGVGFGLTLVLVLATALPGLLPAGPGVDAFAAVARGLLQTWLVVVALAGIVMLWRRLTYRVGVRLFVSYLLIGLVPFALFAFFLFIAGYMAVGQYTSVRFGQIEERLMRDLLQQARSGLQALGAGAVTGFEPEIDMGSQGNSLQLLWLADDGTRRRSSAEAAAIPTPVWPNLAAEWSGTVGIQSKTYMAAIAASGGSLVAVLVPLNLETARALSRDRWFALRFAIGGLDGDDEAETRASRGTIVLNMGAGRTDGPTVRVDGEIPGGENIEPDWFAADRRAVRWFERRFVIWFRLAPPQALWADGTSAEGRSVVTLLRTSPGEAWNDFLASPYEIADGVSRALVGLATVFGVIYLVAVSMAGLLIVRIANSTARLSRGAREVAAGNLKYRIPVRRRDQLGVLADSFNQMAGAIESMLVEVAEKERLAREVELAREIQESLLPHPELNHGELEVMALFRPAAEVGGDLFDLFPEDDGRLTVVVGDVAGHGLPTGLLMAMVKAGVATLVQDGHRGPDLAQGLNRLLMQQPLRRRMVTLALAEIDPAAGILEITSAGHPPPFLVNLQGEVEEILLPSLPLGRSWGGRHPQRRVPFPCGSALLLYSDGLVEACSPSGEEFGFQRLERLLSRLAGRPPRDLLGALLGELDAFRADAPLPDDLTLVVIARNRVSTAVTAPSPAVSPDGPDKLVRR